MRFPSHRVAAGYTLIEMLTTVAILVIVLGLMVSLARHVRDRAAVALTKDTLRRLDGLMEQYAQRNDGRLPVVTAFPPPVEPLSAPPDPSSPNIAPPRAPGAGISIAGAATHPILPPSGRQGAPGLSDSPPDELLAGAIAASARANSRDYVAALRANPQLSAPLQQMPLSMYDEVTLSDAWGTPMVFMPSKHPWVGTAPRDRFFFFSAGPDRQYFTQDDNLYSYEEFGQGAR